MKFSKLLIFKIFFILTISPLFFNFPKANAAEEIKITYSIFSRTIKVDSLKTFAKEGNSTRKLKKILRATGSSNKEIRKILKSLNNYLPQSIKLNTIEEKNNLSDLIMYVVPLRNFLEILQKVPGYSIDIFLKRVPRLINEPYTKEMGIKIAKKVTEKGVVRLVKIAAGANI